MFERLHKGTAGRKIGQAALALALSAGIPAAASAAEKKAPVAEVVSGRERAIKTALEAKRRNAPIEAFVMGFGAKLLAETKVGGDLYNLNTRQHMLTGITGTKNNKGWVAVWGASEQDNKDRVYFSAIAYQNEAGTIQTEKGIKGVRLDWVTPQGDLKEMLSLSAPDLAAVVTGNPMAEPQNNYWNVTHYLGKKNVSHNAPGNFESAAAVFAYNVEVLADAQRLGVMTGLLQG